MTDEQRAKRATARRERYAADPAKVRAYEAARHASNPERKRKLNRAWYAANRDKVMASMRNHRLKSKYGITKAQWDVLFIAQGSRCANLACRSKTPGSRQGWHTDHDHELRKGDPKFIRGILCHPCNVALGHAKDCAQILLGLINYLHFHKLEQ